MTRFVAVLLVAIATWIATGTTTRAGVSVPTTAHFVIAAETGGARFVVSGSGEVADLGSTALTNAEARAAYHAIVDQIPTEDAALQGEDASLYERAISAFKTRFDAKLLTRSLMADQESASLLPPAQSLRDLVISYRGQGLSGDTLLEQLIGASSRTNPAVDQMFGMSPR